MENLKTKLYLFVFCILAMVFLIKIYDNATFLQQINIAGVAFIKRNFSNVNPGNKRTAEAGKRNISNVNPGNKRTAEAGKGNFSNVNPGDKRAAKSRAGIRWVVVGLAVSHDIRPEYPFCLPFITAAWKRVDWNVTVLVFGNITVWLSSPLLRLVHEVTLKTNNAVRFVEIPTDYNPVSYSQVGRLFASIVTPWIHPDDVIMTSDIDIMPLGRIFYDKVNASGIFILNADCCGYFTWKNMTIKMQPMTSIGTTKSIWKKLMGFENDLDHAIFPSFINAWLNRNFQMSIPLENVKKGRNEGWFLDQRVLSIQLHLHKKDIPIHKVKKHFNSRLDRSRMNWGNLNLESRIDSHMYLPSFSGVQWENTLKLVNTTFEPHTVKKLKTFKDDFVKIMKTLR